MGGQVVKGDLFWALGAVANKFRVVVDAHDAAHIPNGTELVVSEVALVATDFAQV